MPHVFEKNMGQAGEGVHYMLRQAAGPVYLDDEGIAIVLLPDRPETKPRYPGDRLPAVPDGPPSLVRIDLVDAGTPHIEAVDPSAFRIGYIGDDAVGEVPTFERVRYRDAWPGIDLLFYVDDRGRLEYDVVIDDGADPSVVAFRVEGAKMEWTDQKLRLTVDDHQVDLSIPLAYLDDGRSIDARFEPRGEGVFGFAVDAAGAMTIDPLFDFYTGGYTGTTVTDIFAEDEGAIVVGYTYGDCGRYPVRKWSRDSTFITDHGFMIELDGGGTPLRMLCFGAAATYPHGVARTSAGDVAVAGFIHSGGTEHGFVAERDDDMYVWNWEYALGGSDRDQITGMELDMHGNIHVAGHTFSDDFPVVGPYSYGSGGAHNKGFVSVVASDGSGLVRSSYVHSATDVSVEDVATGGYGDSYVTGWTFGDDLPADGGSRPYPATMTAFVTKVYSSGSFAWTRYIDGDDAERGHAIDVGAYGSVYVVGDTRSDDGIAYGSGGFMRSSAGDDADRDHDGFVARYSTSGTKTYVTYIDGNDDDRALDVATYSGDHAVVVGRTYSTDLVSKVFAGAEQPARESLLSNGESWSSDGWVMYLDAAGYELEYGSYIGGEDFDDARAAAEDRFGRFYAGGMADKSGFRYVRNWDGREGGAFVAKFCIDCLTPPDSLVVSPGPGMGQITLEWQEPLSLGGQTVDEYRVTGNRQTSWIPSMLPPFPDLSRTAGSSYVHDVPEDSEWGMNYCYQVFAVMTTSSPRAESDPTPETCTETFATPRNQYMSGRAGPGVGQLEFWWDLPSYYDARMTPIEYEVESAPSSSGPWTSYATKTLDDGSVVDSGLGNDVTKCFRVRTVFDATDGPWSPATCRTTFDLPSEPRSLVSDIALPASSRLTWLAPSDNGGTPVTMYRVEAQTQGLSGWSFEAWAWSTSHTDSSPDALSKCYRVAAVNMVGQGPWSNVDCTAEV